MWGKGPVQWSPCETDYLVANKDTRSINELSLYLAKSRAAIKRKLDELDGKLVPKANKKGTAIGKRNDIVKNGKACFFRSGWEANVARWITHYGEQWKYEPDIFYFQGVKQGTVSYCPDFFLEKDNIYIEVKGFLDQKGRTALSRFKKFYPEEFKKLRAVVGSPDTKADKFFKKLGVPVIAYMRDLNKQYKDVIPNWE